MRIGSWLCRVDPGGVRVENGFPGPVRILAAGLAVVSATWIALMWRSVAEIDGQMFLMILSLVTCGTVVVLRYGSDLDSDAATLNQWVVARFFRVASLKIPDYRQVQLIVDSRPSVISTNPNREVRRLCLRIRHNASHYSDEDLIVARLSAYPRLRLVATWLSQTSELPATDATYDSSGIIDKPRGFEPDYGKLPDANNSTVDSASIGKIELSSGYKSRGVLKSILLSPAVVVLVTTLALLPFFMTRENLSIFILVIGIELACLPRVRGGSWSELRRLLATSERISLVDGQVMIERQGLLPQTVLVPADSIGLVAVGVTLRPGLYRGWVVRIVTDRRFFEIGHGARDRKHLQAISDGLNLVLVARRSSHAA